MESLVDIGIKGE